MPGARLLIGVLIGVTFFFVQRMLESGAVVFDASPMVLAWLPTAVLASGGAAAHRAHALTRARTIYSGWCFRHGLRLSLEQVFLRLEQRFVLVERDLEFTALGARGQPLDASGRPPAPAWPAVAAVAAGAAGAVGAARPGPGGGRFRELCRQRRVAAAR